jgi:hypothetical protein
MTDSDQTASATRPSLIERRSRRIVNARNVTIGLAATFVALALVGAIVMRLVDPQNFPSLGLAVWWALQTVTTVGYGDIVPTTGTGQVVGGIEMVIGVSFIAFLTAGVTSTVISGQAGTDETDRMRDERNTSAVVDALTKIGRAITDLDKRLDEIESKIAGSKLHLALVELWPAKPLAADRGSGTGAFDLAASRGPASGTASVFDRDQRADRRVRPDRGSGVERQFHAAEALRCAV